MCGIAGIISLEKDKHFCEKLVWDTLKKIQHRGPDHSGIFYDKASCYNICFGVNRLAIIDIGSSGNQPMFLDNLSMVYNGEVYNYLEIKEELISRGYKFKGHSDTEVILSAFKEWGVDSVKKFNGMFTIALFDKKDNKCYFIRDRAGEKPLYYYCDENIFIFSSELKGILIHSFIDKIFDKNMVFNYLIFDSIPAPQTIFKGFNQVGPGEILIVSFEGNKLERRIKKYWELPDLRPDYSLTEEKVLNHLENLIYDAVKIRLRSDVPVGIFFSGGIDSSLITAITAKIHPNIKTFTIGYPDRKYDESRYAEYVNRYIKTDHTTLNLDELRANIDFQKLAYISDDCTANVSFIPYRRIVEKARQYIKVALSGDGGDEFFCGYTNYNIIIKLYKYRHFFKLLAGNMRFNKKANVLNEILTDSENFDVLMAQFVARSGLSKIRKLFKDSDIVEVKIYQKMDKIKGKSISFWPINYYIGGGHYLTDVVLKTTDRVSMSQGLEVRSILTDYRIIEYMAHVPENIILKKGIDKYILRKILSRYLPKKFVFKRPKQGFSVPLTTAYSFKWEESISAAKDILMNSNSNFFDKKQLENILVINKDKQAMEVMARLVFLAYFIKIWGINY